MRISNIESKTIEKIIVNIKHLIKTKLKQGQKMSYRLIQAPSEAKYISQMPEYSKDLPDNCYLDKTITGSGGTTHALTNDTPYIIAVPFISLADNKQAQHKGVLSVHGGVSDERIRRFVEKSGNKFIVTYDSLFRLERFVDIKTYKLLVDEAHKLVEYGADFKPKVINKILSRFTEFKSYIFMTATPTREEYLPDELETVPKIKIEWSNTNEVVILHQRCNLQFESIVSNICLDHLREEKGGNAYLFYNSVKAIIKSIKTLKKLYPELSPEDVKIICADNDNNRYLISKFLGQSWGISKPVEKDEDGEIITYPKKITFLTATAFEGVDIYDEFGVTYIVSDGRKVHTKLDITTQVSQIVGRIRNSVYNDKINMLWTHSPIEDCITEKEYSDYLTKEEAEAKGMIEDFNKVTQGTKQALISYTKTNPFCIDNSEESLDLMFNTVARKAMMNTYVGMELTYNVINNSTHTNEDRVVVSLRDVFTKLESVEHFKPLSGTDKLKLGKTANFKKVAKDYERALSSGDTEIIGTIETDIDFKDLVDFVEIFTVSKLSSVSYQKSNIINELSKYRAYKESPQVLKNYLRLQKNQFYSLKFLKEKLNMAYSDMGINKKGKASDVELLYKTHKTVKSGANGYLIIGYK